MSTKKHIRPLGNRIVVRRQEAQTSRGGIFLPESAQQKPRQGIVVAVGPGKCDEKGHIRSIGVDIGDNILFASYAGTEYKTDDQEYLILAEDDILAILN